jgi:CTP-dependent riboflavin kinase
MGMTTLERNIILARLRAADQARMLREMREQQQIDRRRSETGDFVVGLIAGLGMSVIIWLAVWSYL